MQKDPAQVLNVPVIPIGPLLATALPFATRPPYILSWLNPQISAPDMMQPELFEKLVMENFGKKKFFTFFSECKMKCFNLQCRLWHRCLKCHFI